MPELAEAGIGVNEGATDAVTRTEAADVLHAWVVDQNLEARVADGETATKSSRASPTPRTPSRPTTRADRRPRRARHQPDRRTERPLRPCRPRLGHTTAPRDPFLHRVERTHLALPNLVTATVRHPA